MTHPLEEWERLADERSSRSGSDDCTRPTPRSSVLCSCELWGVVLALIVGPALWLAIYLASHDVRRFLQELIDALSGPLA